MKFGNGDQRQRQSKGYEMFLETIDQNEKYVVVVSDHYEGRSGTWLLFVAADQIGQQAAAAPHWIGEMMSPLTLQVVTRWFGARRDRWQKWGAVAELIEPAEFQAYIRELMAAEPFEKVLGTTVTFSNDAQEMVIGEWLASSRGRRTELLHKHRFASRAAGKAFRRWFDSGNNIESSATFVHVGYSEGALALRTLLDEIADDELAKVQPRRGRSNRCLS